MKRLFIHNMYCMKKIVNRHEPCRYGILHRLYSQPKKADEELTKLEKNVSQVPSRTRVVKQIDKCNASDDEDVLLRDSKWKMELAWLTKALEPALQLCKWALPSGREAVNRSQPSARSVSDIISSLQRSKIGIQDWTLSDLTVGLYLLYLRQAASDSIEEDVKGTRITSDSIVHDLIYHTELAEGAYKDNASSLAKQSMLRETNVLKFVRDSSVMRPGYYIGIDPRKKLVIFGIRGTHTVYDVITDIVSSGDSEVTFEGFSTHFGTAEAARWFLNHEMENIRKYLAKHEGFRLRLVGHSLGAATASLLAIMLRRKSHAELGFSPDIVSAVGYATPPCVSKELAETCSDYVSTVLMQDDIIPRLSASSLTRLRNEILETDWTSIVEKGDWRSLVDLLSNAKQVISSVQDVARKVVDYANFSKKEISSEELNSIEQPASTSKIRVQNSVASEKSLALGKASTTMPEELFVPGSVYYLKRNSNSQSGSGKEFFTLLKRNRGEHFQRIVLSSNMISDHKCDGHYYALREVLKSLPGSIEESIFR